MRIVCNTGKRALSDLVQRPNFTNAHWYLWHNEYNIIKYYNRDDTIYTAYSGGDHYYCRSDFTIHIMCLYDDTMTGVQGKFRMKIKSKLSTTHDSFSSLYSTLRYPFIPSTCTSLTIVYRNYFFRRIFVTISIHIINANQLVENLRTILMVLFFSFSTILHFFSNRTKNVKGQQNWE